MKNKIKKIIAELAPPILLARYRSLNQIYTFSGSYSNWKEALKDADGYDSDGVLAKVKDATLKVKRGEAAYERDSVTFEKVEYSWPLLSGLLWAASKFRNRLSIIDFGGSLGSSYFQNRMFLHHLDELRWNIVEQKHFVECGKNFFEDEHLKFFDDLDECILRAKPNVVLLCSVLQYLEDPHAFLRRLMSFKVPIVILDRTAFVDSEDKLTMQKVSSRIYRACYPAWFLNEQKFLSLVTTQYSLVAEFSALESSIHSGVTSARDKGFIFEQK